jgi:hypothetical protein
MIGDGDCGEIGGMKMAGETEVLGEKKTAPAPLLSITKSHIPKPGFEAGPPQWEAGV